MQNYKEKITLDETMGGDGSRKYEGGRVFFDKRKRSISSHNSILLVLCKFKGLYKTNRFQRLYYNFKIHFQLKNKIIDE